MSIVAFSLCGSWSSLRCRCFRVAVRTCSACFCWLASLTGRQPFPQSVALVFSREGKSHRLKDPERNQVSSCIFGANTSRTGDQDRWESQDRCRMSSEIQFRELTQTCSSSQPVSPPPLRKNGSAILRTPEAFFNQKPKQTFFAVSLQSLDFSILGHFSAISHTSDFIRRRPRTNIALCDHMCFRISHFLPSFCPLLQRCPQKSNSASI